MKYQWKELSPGGKLREIKMQFDIHNNRHQCFDEKFGSEDSAYASMKVWKFGFVLDGEYVLIHTYD